MNRSTALARYGVSLLAVFVVALAGCATGGGGGGKATLAQAGGRDKARLDEALGLVKDIVGRQAA